MHLYEPPRHQIIPAMRPAQNSPSAPSATPIYDALFAEYRRLFRTVPGDRGGEDELGLPLFGAHGQGLSHSPWGQDRPAAAAHTGYGWVAPPTPSAGQPGTGWGRPVVHPLAALPPGPRRGGA